MNDADSAADVVRVDLPIGSRVVVAGELRLRSTATAASTTATAELAAAIEGWDGPGVVVLNGGTFDLLADPRTTPARALAAHTRLAAALRAVAAAPDRSVIVLAGADDRVLARDGDARREVVVATGATVAGAAELTFDTGEGPRVVRIEPGVRLDERFRIGTGERDDSPLGVHVVSEVLPSLQASWAEGATRLADIGDLPRFVASRVLYRRVARLGWAVLAAFVVALVVKVPIAAALTAHHDLGPWPRRVVSGSLLTAIDLAVVGIALAAVAGRAWRAVAGPAPGDANQAARTEAMRELAGGNAGLVVSHGRAAELVDLDTGFFAATGAASEVVRPRPGRLGLPPAFAPERDVGWLELESGARLHVRLLHGRADTPGATLLERLLTRRPLRTPTRAVGSWPGGPDWPPRAPRLQHLTAVRRRAATAIALAGVLDVLSAVTPPLEDRLRVVLRWVPLAVPQAASALVAVAGLALLNLALGVRRGQRDAWRVAVALLAGSALLHLVKGGDVEEASVAAGVLAYLLLHRGAFASRGHFARLRQGSRLVAAAVVGAVACAVLAVEVITAGMHQRLPLLRAVAAIGERLVGLRGIQVPDRVDDFVGPALLAVGIGGAACLAWLAVRPRPGGARPAVARGRGREIVRSWGSGTLDYFALRADKQLFLNGSSMVAYALHGGVCLVSPDPIGPPWERAATWDAFRAFVDREGWTVAVLGAGEDWLPVYRGFGMQALYVGDEAIVDVRRFSLEGGRNKSLRQAVNRVTEHGYTVTFHDPAAVDADLRDAIIAISDRGRRGERERGFSMTLGRMFDGTDDGLLLAVCRDADGVPVAFCQYVPAPGIGGYSLDVMRRDDKPRPNGILDLVVVETIAYLRARGDERLGLNFATLRAVLAGEMAPGLVGGLQRRLLRRFSASMQIESLWRFNAKFDPDWQPRYLVYDAAEHLVAIGLAVAEAESFWELPLIGRRLRARRPPADLVDV